MTISPLFTVPATDVNVPPLIEYVPPVIEIEVCEVRGHCPVYKVGDKITVDDPEIVLEKTDARARTHAKFWPWATDRV